MTKALLELVQSFIRIPPLRGLAVSTTRLFIGDDTATLLEVPPTDWTGRLRRRHADDQRAARRGSSPTIASYGPWRLASHDGC